MDKEIFDKKKSMTSNGINVSRENGRTTAKTYGGLVTRDS